MEYKDEDYVKMLRHIATHLRHIFHQRRRLPAGKGHDAGRGHEARRHRPLRIEAAGRRLLRDMGRPRGEGALTGLQISRAHHLDASARNTQFLAMCQQFLIARRGFLKGLCPFKHPHQQGQAPAGHPQAALRGRGTPRFTPSRASAVVLPATLCCNIECLILLVLFTHFCFSCPIFVDYCTIVNLHAAR